MIILGALSAGSINHRNVKMNRAASWGNRAFLKNAAKDRHFASVNRLKYFPGFQIKMASGLLSKFKSHE